MKIARKAEVNEKCFVVVLYWVCALLLLPFFVVFERQPTVRLTCIEQFRNMAKLVTCLVVLSSIVLWYLLMFGKSNTHETADTSGNDALGFGVAAMNGHGSPLEGRDRHHHERGGQIRRDINHCWRRYDGYNLQRTIVNKMEQQQKPYGILCNFKCTWFFTVTFPTCDFIYDYKLSCYLLTSLPDCLSVKCTLLNFFT